VRLLITTGAVLLVDGRAVEVGTGGDVIGFGATHRTPQRPPTASQEPSPKDRERLLLAAVRRARKIAGQAKGMRA
jgi:hypothetical protein